MVKEQIKIVIPVIGGNPLLASHEAEIGSKFQEKTLKLLQDYRFQISFVVGV